jgi:hypothetical protein
MMHGKRDIDEYPEEFKRIISEYMKKMGEGNE